MNNNTNANGATFDPYLTWLGIRDPQRPPNHYRLLGLELFENDPEVIASAADRQMTYVRTYQAGQQGEHSQRLLTELTTAKLCLLKPERKRDYDSRLQAAQKPAPLPPTQQSQARPPVSAMPPVNPTARQPMYPAGQPAMQPRPPHPAYAQPVPQAAAGEAYQDGNSPFGSSPVSYRGSSARPAKKNAVMQWSIVGGLVLATIVLAVILANKFSAPETTPIASNPTPPKVTPTATNNPATTPGVVTPPVTNGVTQPGTETTEPTNTEPKNTEPKNSTPSTEPANPGKSPALDPTKQRPGPVKAPLPNVALPGTEEPTPTQPSPMNPASVNPQPMNPVPAVNPMNPAVSAATVPATTTPPANPAPPAVAMTNNDPLNSLPTSSGNNPTEPQPANPLNPMPAPTNPLAMPNPLDPNPLGVNPPNGEMAKPAAPRRPLPSAKEITENRVNVRDVFKTDYASRDPNARNALGKRLLTLARESTTKPAMMYTTYDEARIVSAEVNDLETAFAAHEELTREFAIDRDKDLLETIKAIAKNAVSMNSENAGSVLDIIYESVTAAILDQRLDSAEQLLRYVSNFSPRVPDKVSREVGFRDLQKKVGEHKAFAIKNKDYKEALAKNPSDGDANLELGKFWAFQQGNFEKGLAYLAKGSDTEIREAANRELTIKPDSPEFVKVADAWWEAANKLAPEPRSTVKIHAAYSYAQALPSLKALERGLAESRINEAYKSFKPNNREVKELIKLLLTRVNWKMDWKSKSQLEPVLTFKTTGICDSFEYPTWKLLDNYYVVCFRDRSNPDRSGNPFANRFRRGPSGNNNNNDNNSSKSLDTTKNVMQIAVTANRIEVRVLNDEGKLRNEGTGTPE